MKKEKETNLGTIFKHGKIVALPSLKNTGKTNNLVSMIKQLRDTGNNTPIYTYGFPEELQKYLKKTLKCKIVSSLKQIKKLKNAILICDEFQQLRLNDRRHRDDLMDFTAKVYHNNLHVILSSPNIREFNSVIGSVIEVWCLKTVNLDECINGSQLKKAVNDYKGTYKVGRDIVVGKGMIILDVVDEELVLSCEYLEMADTKKKLLKLF